MDEKTILNATEKNNKPRAIKNIKVKVKRAESMYLNKEPKSSSSAKKHIEIWADSFHEGVWCCDHICSFLSEQGYKCERDYVQGFIPHFLIKKEGTILLDFLVYGSYKSWTPIPQKILDLITWGKPDFVAYSAEDDQILFAVEETAATPTGNQAMQRCERQYGSAHLRIPYWYFVSEFGEHGDGGVRRDNIWPSIAAIKLTFIHKTPCVVLHYSDIDNVEDYNAGKGLGLLFSSLSTIILNHIKGNTPLDGLEPLLAEQYKDMQSFILSQWENVIDYLPSKNILREENTAKAIARYALGKETAGDDWLKSSVLVWPLTDGVPVDILNNQKGKDLIKWDPLALLLEQDVSLNKCYVLSNNAGSGKPTNKAKISSWVDQQRELFNSSDALSPPAVFTMRVEDFPETDKGNIHVTTSKNIVYLYDKWSDLKKAIEDAFPRLKGKLTGIPNEKPVFLYVSNSIKPGRLFGDPFTGQMTAYSTCFGKFDSPGRAVVAYFPHQVHTQIFDKKGNIGKNKGITLYSELTDYLLFNAGVAVSLNKKEVL